MSTALTPAKKGKAELAEQISFTDEQLRLMKDTVARGATDNEFLLFLHLAKTYGLDPFAKEIWCLKYGSSQPATVFTSRDGYLKIASRDAQMNGLQSDVVCAADTLEKLADGTVRHVYGNPRGPIVGAYALVYRKDRAVPAYFYAPFGEYSAGSNPTWKKYPSAMIVKVAEAMALKRAFSISGLVTQEEIGLDMSQEPEAEAGTEAVVVGNPPAATPKPVLFTLDEGIKAVLAIGSGEALQALWQHSNLKQHKADPVFELVCAATKLRWAAPDYQSPEQAENEVASRAQRDLAHKLLASSKNDAYRLEALHLLNDAGMPWVVCTQLVDKAMANTKKAAAPQPTRPVEITASTTRPTTDEQGQPITYATPAQKQEIINLLNHPAVTRQEKAKMLEGINRLTEERATQAIAKLKKSIEERGGIAVAA